MSDLFHEHVPDEFLDRVIAVMALTPRHSYQVLTKRPERMRAYFAAFDWNRTALSPEAAQWHSRGGDPEKTLVHEWPLPNVWLGVSVENQETADERIPLLLQTPTAVRFLSIEPMLGFIDLDGRSDLHRPGVQHWDYLNPATGHVENTIDWIIVGGESGPGARPMHPNWALSIRDQCQAAGIPFFFKQWGNWVPKIFLPHSPKYIKPWGTLDNTGNWFPETTPWNGQQGSDSETGEYVMVNVGKQAAGHLLDGKTYHAFPGDMA